MNKEFNTLLQEEQTIRQSMTNEEYQDYLTQQKTEFEVKHGNQAYKDTSTRQMEAIAIMSIK